MSYIFIGATGDHINHTLFTWAILQRLKERGLTVGFMKPFGTHAIMDNGFQSDRDALLFKDALNLPESIEQLCLFPMPEEAFSQMSSDALMSEINALAAELHNGKDLLVIMGSKHVFYDDTASSVSDIALSTNLGASFILVDQYVNTAKSIYTILSLRSLLKDRMIGAVLNRIPPQTLQPAKKLLKAALVDKGIKSIIAIPEDPQLSLRNVNEIVDILNGDILNDSGGLTTSVAGLTAGSSDLKGEMAVFKRIYNKILLLKPEIHKDGEADTPSPRPIAGIILTCGRLPPETIIKLAEKTGIPLISVKDDTFDALEKLEKAPVRLSAVDKAKVDYLTSLMDDDGELDALVGLIETQNQVKDS